MRTPASGHMTLAAVSATTHAATRYQVSWITHTTYLVRTFNKYCVTFYEVIITHDFCKEIKRVSLHLLECNAYVLLPRTSRYTPTLILVSQVNFMRSLQVVGCGHSTYSYMWYGRRHRHIHRWSLYYITPSPYINANDILSASIAK